MALTSYTIVSGNSALDLATKVKTLTDDGQVLIGDAFIRSGAFYQCVGEGSYLRRAAVTDFKIVGASNPSALQVAVNDALTADLQPYGAPFIREGALFQVMADPAADSGGGTTVAWADVTGKPTEFPPVAATTTVTGGVKRTTTIAATPAITATADTASAATDVAGLLADHNDLVTKYNALRTDAAAIRTSLEGLVSALRTAGSVT